jgi:hypothetical protein
MMRSRSLSSLVMVLPPFEKVSFHFRFYIKMENYASEKMAEWWVTLKYLYKPKGNLKRYNFHFDRNYASIECMDYLEKSGVNYLIRLHKGDYQRERDGMAGADEEVSLACTSGRLRALRKEDPQRAQVLVFNMVQDLISGAEEKLKRKVKRKGYRYGMRINENRAIGLFLSSS